jgi:tetratricopeptide (TPR) repeat protein
MVAAYAELNLGNITVGTAMFKHSGILVASLAGLAALAASATFAQTRTVSLKVGPALTAAKDAVGKKQFDVAMAKLKEAEAADKKTPYDQFQINETTAYALYSQKKFAEAAALYEKSLDSQFLTPEQSDQRVKQVSQFYLAARQYPKGIEFGKRWLAKHPSDKTMYGLMADAYYQQGDCKQAREVAGTAVSTAEKAGEVPEEGWLQVTQVCSTKLDDKAGTRAALEKLVRYHSKPDYWSRLLASAESGEKSDEVMVGLFRLKRDVGALKSVDDYSTYSQMTMDVTPEEALRVVQSGFDKKVLGVDANLKERHQRLLTGVKEKAEAKRARLGELEKAVAAGSASAQTQADLGMEYFSYEQYDKAIGALEKALKAGGLKDTEQTRIALGIAYLRKGQKDQARAQFKAVPNSSPFAKVSNLWMLRTYS